MTNQDIIYLSKEDEKRYKNKLDTAELIKQCYKLQCKGDRLTPEKLYALCQLTWWTKKYFEDDYWMVAKLPALWLLWSKSGKVPKNLNDLSELNKYGFPLSFVKYAEKDTGMVNYYNAYRNSSKDWIRKNFDELAPLIHSAAKLKSEKEAIEIAEKLEKLERIPKQNNYKVKSNPSNLLTPLIACLDPRLRFPIVNKNNNVKELHRKLHITNSTISEQYKTLIGKINQHGIKDALFLDVASAKLVKLKSLKPNDTSKPKPSVVSIPLAFKMILI